MGGDGQKGRNGRPGPWYSRHVVAVAVVDVSQQTHGGAGVAGQQRGVVVLVVVVHRRRACIAGATRRRGAVHGRGERELQVPSCRARWEG
jgi:hypothetical protein